MLQIGYLHENKLSLCISVKYSAVNNIMMYFHADCTTQTLVSIDRKMCTTLQ